VRFDFVQVVRLISQAINVNESKFNGYFSEGLRQLWRNSNRILNIESGRIEVEHARYRLITRHLRNDVDIVQ